MILRGLALAVLVGLAAPAAAADPAHDLFIGQNPSAAGRRVARFACHNCHGRDGRGGIEGDVPEIAGDALRSPTDLRPAYDFEAFRNALGAGIDSSGRKLARIMPRYDLTEAELALLWDYVAEMPVRQAWGVTAQNIRFGVIITADQPDIGQRYLRRLQDEMAQAFPSGQVYGRKVEIIGMRDPVAQARQVLAAIAALRNGADDFIMKPFQAEQIFLSMRRTLMRRQIVRENSLLRLQMEQMRDDDSVVGESEVMQV